MNEAHLQYEKRDSGTLKCNAKGEYAWDVKMYWDSEKGEYAWDVKLYWNRGYTEDSFCCERTATH